MIRSNERGGRRERKTRNSPEQRVSRGVIPKCPNCHSAFVPIPLQAHSGEIYVHCLATAECGQLAAAFFLNAPAGALRRLTSTSEQTT